jgi:hypothetical protein
MESSQPARPKPAQIHISGGNFHQSQIALGEQVTQQQRIENISDADVVESLVQLLVKSGTPVSEAVKDEIRHLVTMTNNGQLDEAKPLLQKLFGFAGETVKQAAWGILTALLTKAMGL